MWPIFVQITDELAVYNSPQLRSTLGLFHLSCNHSRHERTVRGFEDNAGRPIGTQAIESEWNQLRRFLQTQYVDTSILNTESLQLYVDEFTYRQNNRILAVEDRHRAFGVICHTLQDICWQEEVEKVRNRLALNAGLSVGGGSVVGGSAAAAGGGGQGVVQGGGARAGPSA